jgi:hypothetical protein
VKMKCKWKMKLIKKILETLRTCEHDVASVHIYEVVSVSPLKFEGESLFLESIRGDSNQGG